MSDAGMLRKRSTKLQRGSKVDEVAAEQVRNVSPARVRLEANPSHSPCKLAVC